ncbi:epimerase [Rothia nasimurium]|uniref:NAD(P)H-binding protein n=1 Tax=Luteibacter anthropi TaxID=564369 RepID=A0A7X5UBB4_9GAMM|nr:NAD(P)H-binding protein [Luteibacter anthropi]NII07164.1 NAD(P)H-binding protein [Luteibacter anthropi]
MRVLLFGASGMVGQGVLRECLRAEDVSEVVAVGRSPLAVSHPKLTVLVRADLADPAAIASLPGHFDACFFCVGVTSFRMDEATYTRLTYDMTLAVATALSRRDPDMTFVYVSGAGADSTEHGKTMWARVRGRTENALARLPFRRVHAIRPGIIRPMHGVTSRTRAYRMLYPIFAPLLPLLRAWLPHLVATTESIGQALLGLARNGYGKTILEMADIEEVAQRKG